MMDIKTTVARAQRAFRYSPECTNETLAKSILIVPFFAQLGYDPSDPRSIMQEHQVHSNKRYPNRADIVLFSGGKPVIIVECKAPGKALGRSHTQLSEYFQNQDSVLAVLANGLEFRFFSDGDSDGIPDEEPFFSISMEKLASRGVTEIEQEFMVHISRDGFDEDWLAKFAQTELLRIRLTRWLSEQLRNPKPEFCRYVLAQLDIKHIRDNKIDFCKGVLQEAFSHGLADEIFRKIKGIKAREDNTRRDQPLPKSFAAGIVTTEHEKQIFQLCKNRLREQPKRPAEGVEIEKIKYRDRIEKFCVYHGKLHKGRFFDDYEEDARDKFVFYINGEKRTVYDVRNIDKPLLAAFRQRLSESENW